MRDHAASILAAPLLETLEPAAKMPKLALAGPHTLLEQAVGGTAQARAETLGHDGGELASGRLA